MVIFIVYKVPERARCCGKMKNKKYALPQVYSIAKCTSVLGRPNVGPVIGQMGHLVPFILRLIGNWPNATRFLGAVPVLLQDPIPISSYSTIPNIYREECLAPPYTQCVLNYTLYDGMEFKTHKQMPHIKLAHPPRLLGLVPLVHLFSQIFHCFFKAMFPLHLGPLSIHRGNHGNRC